VGKALEKKDEAQELIDFIESKIDKVKSVTDTIDEKPTVYYAPRGCSKGFYDPKEGRDFTRTVAVYEPLNIAGGMNVAKNESAGNLNVGIEQIIAWSPEYIFVACSSPDTVDAIDMIRNAKDLQSIRAIQNDTVYNCFYPNCRGSPPDRSLFNMIYMAKLLHPAEFKDLNLEKEGNEIFEAFLGVDGVFTEYADYLIWPREYLEAQQ
jgi:iron complex transport system substrate-binding protein